MTTKSPTVLISETNNMSTLIDTGGAGVIVLQTSAPADLSSLTCDTPAFGTPNATTGVAILNGLPLSTIATANGRVAGFVVRSGDGDQLLSGTVNGNYGFTAVDATDLITCAEHPFADDDIVRVRVGGGSTLPAGLSLGTDYYVIDSATDEFRLSLTAGGATVDITDTGTGVFKVAKTDAALIFDGGSSNPLDIVNGQIVQITSFVYNPQI